MEPFVLLIELVLNAGELLLVDALLEIYLRLNEFYFL